MIKATTKTYNKENYSLETANRWLSEWQIEKWKKQGVSDEGIQRNIDSAKKEIKNVLEKTPYTIWYLDLPRGKYDFSIGNSTYRIIITKQKAEDYGWKSKNWKKNTYSVIKTNDEYSPFDKYILYYFQNKEKKQDIVNWLNSYFQDTIQEDIEEKYLPNIKMNQGGNIESNFE